MVKLVTDFLPLKLQIWNLISIFKKKKEKNGSLHWMYVNYIVLAHCSYILASRSDLHFFSSKKDKNAFKIFGHGQYKLKIESKEKSILHA